MRYLILLSFFLAARLSNAYQDSTIQRFENALQKAFPPGSEIKLFIRFNQPEFVAGDTAFFSVYALDAQQMKPIQGRQIINVIITDVEDKQMITQKVLVTDGFAKNQIVLPPEIRAGRYGLTAFPDGQQNDMMFFRSVIDIAGETYEAAQSSPATKVCVEGGSLVSGVANKVVVIGPPSTSATVLNNKGKEERSISFNESGFAVLYLSPVEDDSYLLRLPNGNSIPFPQVNPSGVAIGLGLVPRNSNFNFVLQTARRNTLKGSQTFVIYRYGQIFFKATVALERKKQLLVPIDMKGLPSGVYQAVLLDASSNVLSERAFFFKEGGNNTAALHVSGLQASYGIREKVRLNISEKVQTGPLPLSVSIYKKDLFKTSVTRTDQYLDFQADVVEHIPENIDVNTINDYLIGCTSVFSAGALVRAGSVPASQYSGHLLLSGTIVDLNGNPVERDSLKLSFFVQNDVSGYHTWVDRQSRFRVPLLMNFYGLDQVFYTIEQNGERIEDVRLIPAQYKPSLFKFNLNTRDTGVEHPLFKTAAQARAFSKAFETRESFQRPATNVLNPHAKIEEETVGVDATVRLSDYLIFPTMEETLREVVPYVQHRWVNGAHRVRLWFDETKYYADGPPLYFIDGVATDDTDYFMSLNPANVQTIKVIASFNKIHVFGPAGRFGVILVETNIPDNAANVPAEHTFAAIGLTAPLQFHNQVNIFPPRVPDMRFNLHWDSDVSFNNVGEAQLNFLTSDLVGDYVIVISGVTLDGRPIHHEQNFQVIFKDDAN